MRFSQIILRRILSGQEGYLKALQSMVIRFTGKKGDTPYPRKYQIRFFFTLFLMMWSLPFRIRFNRKHEVLFYDTILNPESLRKRRYFLHKYVHNAGGEAAILGFDGNSTFPKLYVNGLSFAKLWAFHRAGSTFVRAAFLDMFKPNRIHWMWRLALVNKTFQQILWHSPKHSQYQFFSYEPSTYLSALMAGRYLKGYTPATISSNSVQFSNNRYHWNPKLAYKLCSRFQEAETQHYINFGWMNIGSRDTWGLEEEVYIDQVEQTAPTYDIGIYSGAFWARTHDLWRSGDLDALRGYAYNDNPVYLAYMPVLQAIIDLKQQYDLKVKVYFHPYEFSLMEDHGIDPPYLEILTANGIDWEQDGKTSWDNFYEPKVGVAMLSTIVFDRLHYGLPSYFYSGEGVSSYNLDLKYLSSCADYVYQSPDHLVQQLKMELSL